MPTWLLSAFALLRSQFGRVVGAAGGAARPLALGAGGAAAGVALADPAGGLFPNIFGADGRPRRRRRRRALTASDRADIAFVSGILGKAAGDRFAVALIAGLTR